MVQGNPETLVDATREMLTVDDREQIRRAFFVEGKSRRQLARELKRSRRTINKALQAAEPEGYTQKVPRAAPVLSGYKSQIDGLLAESATLPRKQRYTAHRIYECLKTAGYTGSEASVHGRKVSRANVRPLSAGTCTCRWNSTLAKMLRSIGARRKS